MSSVTQLSPLGIPRGASSPAAATRSVVGGNDADTRLLIPFAGGDGDVGADDEAVGGRAPQKLITFWGAAALSRAAGHYHATHLRLGGGVGSFVEVEAHPDFNFRGAPFALDFWVNVREAPRAHLLAFHRGADRFMDLGADGAAGGAARLRLRWRRGATTILHAPGVDHQLVAGEWTHVALQRDGAEIRLYIGGTRYLTAAIPETEPMDFDRHALWIGRTPEGYAHADFEQVRIRMGVIWSGASFLPYANPYIPRIEAHCRGCGVLRAAASAELRGASGLARVPIESELRGAARLRASTEQKLGGRSILRAAAESELRGFSGLVRVPIESELRGAARLRASAAAELRGASVHNLALFESELRGAARLRASAALELRGAHRLHRLVDAAWRGRHTIENSTLDRYELYIGVDAAPDLDAAPNATFAALPYTTSALTAGHVYHFILRRRNRHGLASAPLEAAVLTLDGAGNWVPASPAPPTQIRVEPAAAATIRARAVYFAGVDPASLRATHWLIYTKVGADPTPGVDAPTVVAMMLRGGLAKLDWTSAAFADGDDVRVMVRTRRAGASNYDSANSEALAATADEDGPASPSVAAFTEGGGVILRKAGPA